MPSEEQSTVSDLSVWLAGAFRFTLFPRSNSVLSDQDWWADVVGTLPDKKTDQPRIGLKTEEGVFKNGRLVLEVHPTRIDWNYLPPEEMELNAEAFSNIGNAIEALDEFAAHMGTWLSLNNIPSIQRLAFGSVLHQPVRNVKEGYSLLSTKYLPFEIDVETASDFMYQINRRRKTTANIPGLEINRLSKWSVAFMALAQLSPYPRVQPRAFACRLELDINTNPEFEGDFEAVQYSTIFQELVEAGKEIALKGDIP